MDQGAQGLFDTISLLDTSGLSYVGAGNNISEAHRPLFFEKDGFYSEAEKLYNFCTDHSRGLSFYEVYR